MSWVGGNRFLSLQEMQLNATYIRDYLIVRGWTLNSICGMLGNMQTESTINPSIWQNLESGNLSLGYGLVQWTPSTKYFNWCDANGLIYSEMDSNLKRIIWEVDNNEQWGNSSTGQSPPYPFIGFTESEETPYTLAMNFLIYYERPRNQNQPNRGIQANYWYEYLSGSTPPDPEPPDPPNARKGMPLYFYLRR